MDPGTEQAIQQDVAIASILFLIARDNASEDQFAGKTSSRRYRSTQARMVRLDATRRDERITLPGQRFSEQEFELSEFLASAANSHEVVALHEQTNAGSYVPERLLKAVEPLYRRDAIKQGNPVEPPECRQLTVHRVPLPRQIAHP